MVGLETPRHRLPLLAVSQAQKEITHNEALVLIDALLHMSVEQTLSLAPEATDNDFGKCWLIGEGAGGLWANKSGHIALWVGSWRFVAPVEGMRLWDNSSGCYCLYVANQWSSAPVILEPAGGTVVDSEARAALGMILKFFRRMGMFAT